MRIFTRMSLSTALAAATWFGFASKTISAESKSPDLYSDARISFPVPEGGKVQRVERNTYLVFVGESFHYLMLRGEAEPEEMGRERTEMTRAEIEQHVGKPVRDEGAIITVGDVSEVTRHEIDGEAVYLFTHSATAVSEKEEESGTGYNTIGFGSVGRSSIWFQHTSTTRDDHPASILAFLKTVTFKESELAAAGESTFRALPY